MVNQHGGRASRRYSTAREESREESYIYVPWKGGGFTAEVQSQDRLHEDMRYE